MLPGRSGALPIVGKMLVDQTLMAPLGTLLFFMTLGLMEGYHPVTAAEATAAKLGPALAANYTLWPAAHVVNFAVVPPAQRILYINVIGVSGCSAGVA